MSLKYALAACMAAAALTFAACGDDDDDDGEPSQAEKEASAIALEVIANDTSVTAPTSIEAGLVELKLENTGKDAHAAQLIRYEGDHTAAEVLKIIRSDEPRIPQWLRGAGGVGTTKPGATSTATQVLEPGKYIVLDDEPDKPQTAELEVTGGAAEGELPAADATVTASEYTFETSGLKPGKNTIQFENTGQELHHVIAFAVKPDATRESILEFFKTEKGPPPFRGDEEDTDGTAVIDGGVSQVTELDLQAGKTAFVCFIPDRGGGPPHAAKGMLTVEEIG